MSDVAVALIIAFAALTAFEGLIGIPLLREILHRLPKREEIANHDHMWEEESRSLHMVRPDPRDYGVSSWNQLMQSGGHLGDPVTRILLRCEICHAPSVREIEGDFIKLPEITPAVEVEREVRRVTGG